MNRLNFNHIRAFAVALIFITISPSCFGQSKEEKTKAIIEGLNIVESLKGNYQTMIDYAKYQATGSDSIRLVELESRLTDEEILKRMAKALDQVFSEKEIDEIYLFIQSSAFKKILNLDEEAYNFYTTPFDDIDKELQAIMDSQAKDVEVEIEEPTTKFEPIPVDREDGFYATVDYDGSNNRDIRLENKPSITPKDILEAKKSFDNFTDRPTITIKFNKKGARKFYQLTRGNIGKSIAIVIDKKIVAIPMVHSEIVGGNMVISGNYTEEEVDSMIRKLKGE